MNTSFPTFAIAWVFAAATSLCFAQTTSTSTSQGGAGGAGGSAAGGTATGGMATGGAATNNTSGVGTGGSASGGTGGSASGGTASASGGNVGSVSTGASSAYLGDVTVNYNVPASPAAAAGKAGLGVGVDPVTGHIVSDNNINYSGSYKLKNTPDVNVGGPASGPCNGFSGGVGVSLPGISVGANASTVDEGCSARETARIAAMIGRMDIANAILDNLPIVQAAMKAKAAREAMALPQKTQDTPVTTAPAQWSPAPVPVQTPEQAEAALREQQRLAQEALTRQATMAKVNDTLKFTDAATQGNEKTPQQLMAEEANKKLAAAKSGASVSAAPSASSVASVNPAPAAAPVSNPQAPPTIAALAQQSSKLEATARAQDRSSVADSQSAKATPQSVNADLPAKLTDNRPAAATTEERVRAAKAALNLQ